MTRLAYLDCVGGLSGDMLLAALLDAGAPEALLHGLPAQLGMTGVGIEVSKTERHGIGATHVRVVTPRDEPTRTPAELRAAIDGADVPAAVRERAAEALNRLAEAEAAVHRVPAGELHLHELGSADTLVDLCGAFLLLDALGVDRVECSALPFARALVRSEHGVLPSPPPAVLALLRGAPFVGVDTEAELVTPTGAAIAAVAVQRWGPLPALTLDAVGTGAGTRELPDRPNVLRIVLGETLASSGPAPSSPVVLLETNLDDLLPELVPDAVERCFAAGALDVWTVPAQMKKGRPGFILSALARPADETAVAHALLTHTSTLGVRVSDLRRHELERSYAEVEVAGHRIGVKLGRLEGRVVNVAPEHDDCARVAAALGQPVKQVWAQALVAAEALREPAG